MGKTAADRSPVANCRMRNMCDCFRQQRRVRANVGRPQEIRVTGERTDPEYVPVHDHSLQLGEVTDVDDDAWRNQAQVHGRHQTLAAGEHLCRLSMGGKQLKRVVNAGWTHISESRGFHGRDLSPADLFWFSGLEVGNHQRSSLFIE
jgi:hypothetical protein